MGQISERQFHTVGVLLISRANLDSAYRSKWAASLGGADLLAKRRKPPA